MEALSQWKEKKREKKEYGIVIIKVKRRNNKSIPVNDNKWEEKIDR